MLDPIDSPAFDILGIRCGTSLLTDYPWICFAAALAAGLEGLDFERSKLATAYPPSSEVVLKISLGPQMNLWVRGGPCSLRVYRANVLHQGL